MNIKHFSEINSEKSIVIIGSGMGGGTLAVLLARAGYHPIVIEAGDENECSIADNSEEGRPFGIVKNRAIEIGGSTNLWHGVTAPLDESDFRADHPDRHPGWPISREALLPYWTAAATFMGFRKPDRLELENWPDEIRARASDLGIDFSRVSPKLFRVLRRPTRLKPLLLELERKQQLTLLRGCRARRLEWSSDGADAIAVIVNRGGALYRVPASKIIIAAGALESPVVLLNSPSGESGGRYNPAGHVGRYLGDHPMGFLGKVRVQPSKRAPLYSDMSDHMGNRIRIGLRPADTSIYGNSNLYLRPSIGERRDGTEDRILLSLIALRRPSSIRFRDVFTLLAHPRVVYRVIANRFSLPIRYRVADLFFVTEQSSIPGSQVKLSTTVAPDGMKKGEYRWQVPEHDYQRLNLMFQDVLMHSLQVEGLKFTEAPKINNWINQFTSAAHHLGTMRMSASAADGVVSTDLLLHGVNNVWVCDGSVFPSVGNANPSLTICALAHRLFEHLQPQLESHSAKNDITATANQAPPRALLTGATGFIGNAIAKKAAGRLSLISSVRADASSFQPLGHVRVDLGDDRSVAKAVVGCDVVIHAAYDSSQPHREGEFARRLVEAGLREGIRSFVFFGSYSTYNSLCDRVNEASPHSPVRLPYIAGKQDLEDCLIELSESNPDARIILLQPTIVMGEGGSWNRFFNRAANASEVLLPHRGRAPINVIDVNIVAEATVRAALENTLLLSGFHKFLLNGDVNSTWEEMILDRGSINQPRILDAGPGLLAEGLITNTLLCLKYTNRHTWNYPRVKGWEYGTRSSQIKGMVLRGLDRLTVASWAVIDAGAARDAGLID